jgi:hypothetical protein
VQDTEEWDKSLLCWLAGNGVYGAFMETEYGLPQWQAEDNKAI